MNCHKCGSNKVQRSDGRWRCKPCNNAYQRENYQDRIEVLRERKRKHMATLRQNPETRERMNAARRGNDRYLTQGKEYARNLRTRHFFRWRARNWGYGVTARELASLWRKQRGRCALSGCKLDRTAHLDHIIPESRGGEHTIGNLRWLDPMVNVARGNMADEDFSAMCSQVAEWIGRRIMVATKQK